MKELIVQVPGDSREAREMSWQVWRDGTGFLCRNGDREIRVEMLESRPEGMELIMNHRRYRISFTQNGEICVGDSRVRLAVKTPGEAVRDRLLREMGTVVRDTDVKVEMPGLVVKLLVEPGDTVKKGDGLVIVEAMKMENVIRAPQDGIVESVAVQAGDSVEKGAQLLRLKAPE